MRFMHMDLDLRLLNSFLAVIDEGSVNAAAQRLRLSQPAVSRQVRDLERRLNVQLFERTPTKLALTTAGFRFAPRARDLMEQADRLADTTRRLADGNAPYFHIACPEATVRGVIAPFVAGTGAPIFHTSLSLANQVYERVLRREVDFAVNTLPPPLSLASEKAATGQLSVFLAPDHPLSARTVISIEDLRGHPLILLTPGSGLRRLIDEELWAIRDQVEIVAEPESSDLAIALAIAGNGLCVDLINPAFASTQRPLVREDGTRPTLQLYAAWERNHYAATEIRTLVQRMRRWDDKRHAQMTGRKSGMTG